MRDFIYSGDVAYWCMQALEKAPACTPINLGSGKRCTIREVAETIANSLPSPPRIEWDNSKPSGDPVRVMSVDRAAALIGFEPRSSLKDGIAQTIEWYLNNRSLASQRKNLVA